MTRVRKRKPQGWQETDDERRARDQRDAARRMKVLRKPVFTGPAAPPPRIPEGELPWDGEGWPTPEMWWGSV